MYNKSIYHARMAGTFLMLFLTGCASVVQDDLNRLSKTTYTIKEGLELEIDSYLEQKVFVAQVDPDKASVSLVKAAALEKPSTIADREHALIAINAGYFLKNGMPAGALKIDSKWIHKPRQYRGAVGWTKSADSFYFDRLKLKTNQQIISEFNQTYWWENQRYVVGGAPLLIYNKKALDPHPEKVIDTFLTRRYARTALCIDEHRRLLLVVVEGGDYLSWTLGFRRGLSIAELTAYLKTKNCVHALNLDGGKSTTMVVQGKVVNSQPHFSGERAVSDVMLVK